MRNSGANLRLERLPRLLTAQWGMYVASGEPQLAARLVSPSPSGAYPPSEEEDGSRTPRLAMAPP